MAAVEQTHQLKSRSFALQGAFFTLLLTLFGIQSLDLFGLNFTLIFVPIISIYLWPRSADPIYSYIGLFIVGIWFDFIKGGALGVFSLIFLVSFLIFRPHKRSKNPPLTIAWAEFCIWMLVPFGLIVVLDVFQSDLSANFGSLIRALIVAILVFPVLFYLKKVGLLLIGSAMEDES